MKRVSNGAGRRRRRVLAGSILGSVLLLTGCSPLADIGTSSKFSPSQYGVSASPRLTNSRNVPKGGGRYQVGQPYKVAGRWYHPREEPDLDVLGYASWYGPNFHGRQTANGEIFDMYHLSGAHPTLPLPSYVRVTNTANGRSTLVRINDRGPFAGNRVIDLSRRTAEVLGMIDQGVGQVRVQYVGRAPLEGDDMRFLVASIGNSTPLEDTGTRHAYEAIQVADAGPADAIGALLGETLRASDIPVRSYAGEALRLDIGAAHQAAGTGGDAALLSFMRSLDEDARAVAIEIGTFADPAVAGALASEFALYGAVEENQISVNGAPATRLVLSHLKPGATPADVAERAAALGLGAILR